MSALQPTDVTHTITDDRHRNCMPFCSAENSISGKEQVVNLANV